MLVIIIVSRVLPGGIISSVDVWSVVLARFLLSNLGSLVLCRMLLVRVFIETWLRRAAITVYAELFISIVRDEATFQHF